MIDQHLDIPLKRPLSGAWIKNRGQAPIPTRHEIWDNLIAEIRVISTVELTSIARGVEHHVSISEGIGQARYPSKWAIDKVRKDFGLEDFELDDHGSKVAHLWRPVERDKRGDCDCK